MLRQYAMSVFKRADDLDRSGVSDEYDDGSVCALSPRASPPLACACRKTAKSYSVAGSFFDVLKQFGEQDPEVTGCA